MLLIRFMMIMRLKDNNIDFDSANHCWYTFNDSHNPINRLNWHKGKFSLLYFTSIWNNEFMVNTKHITMRKKLNTNEVKKEKKLAIIPMRNNWIQFGNLFAMYHGYSVLGIFLKEAKRRHIYPNVYKHYDIILKIYQNFGLPETISLTHWVISFSNIFQPSLCCMFSLLLNRKLKIIIIMIKEAIK